MLSQSFIVFKPCVLTWARYIASWGRRPQIFFEGIRNTRRGSSVPCALTRSLFLPLISPQGPSPRGAACPVGIGGFGTRYVTGPELVFLGQNPNPLSSTVLCVCVFLCLRACVCVFVTVSPWLCVCVCVLCWVLIRPPRIPA